MNKILMTGLALGIDTGPSQAINFDYSWLIINPSSLVWADKILISKIIWDVSSSGKWPSESPKMAKSLKMIFEILKNEGIIEIVNPAEILIPDISEAIMKEVEKDSKLLPKVFPNHIKSGSENVPGEILIDNCSYCSVHIWTIYASILLSRAWNAQCLFNPHDLHFCKYKFGIKAFPKEVEPGKILGFSNIFNAYIPDYTIFPEYVLEKEVRCSTCEHEEKCKSSYLSKLENNIKNVLNLRNYDEIQQLKAVINEIIKKRNKSGGIIDPDDIFNDFQRMKKRINRQIKLIFPQVKRWSNIIALLSIPVVVAGVSSSYPLITLGGLALAGLSKASKEIVDLLSSKYSWIGFISNKVDFQLNHD